MSGKVIFKNASYLFLSNVIVRIITAIVTILLARTLRVQEYGILSVSLAFAAVAGYFTDLGLTHTLMREATKMGSNLSVLMSSFLKIRLFLALLTGLICFILFEFLYTDHYIKGILNWVVIPTIVGAALQGVGAAYFQVIEKMQYTAIIRTIAGILTAISLFLGIIFDWSLTLIAPVYGLSNVLAGLVSIVIVIKRIDIFTGWDKNILKGMFSFTVSGFAIMLIPQLGPIILERVSSFEEVGYFSVAYRIPSVLYQIPGIVAVAFYPILFRFGNQRDFENHLKLNTLQMKVMSFLGILMALPFLLFSEWWTMLLFGEEWLLASTSLSIMSIIVILQGISYPIADALTTTGLQSKRMRVLVFGLLISIICYLVLGSHYGDRGGAISAAITELSLLLGFLFSYPSGKVLLLRGILFNLGAFGITIVVYFTVLTNTNLDPLIENIIALSTFIVSGLMLDQELRVRCILLLKSLRNG